MKKRGALGTVGSGLAILLIMLFIAAHSTMVRAASPADFYKGETLTWVVATGPGSISDLLSRMIAIHLGQELGVKVRVEAMAEEGLNYAYAKAKPDGLTVVSKATSAITFNELAKAPGVMYKTAKFNFISDLQPDVGALYVKKGSPYSTLDALKAAKGLKAGATTSSGFLSASAAILFEILGVDAKVIPGYKSPVTVFMALEQKEIDLVAFQLLAGLPRIKDQSVTPLFVVNDERYPALPDLPTLEELGVKIPPEMAAAYGLISKTGQAVMTSPGVPADRVKYLRDAFDRIGQKEEVKKEVERITGLVVPFEKGEKLQASIEKIMSNEAVSDTLNKVVKKYSVAAK